MSHFKQPIIFWYSIFFAFQGLIIIVWWIFLFIYPKYVYYFFSRNLNKHAIESFIYPDLGTAVVSIFLSIHMIKGTKYSAQIAYFVCGCLFYSSGFCITDGLLSK